MNQNTNVDVPTFSKQNDLACFFGSAVVPMTHIRKNKSSAPGPAL